MNILCDTHILLWAITDDDRLTTEARNYILNPKNDIYYSVVSMWEVQLKHELKSNLMPISGREFLHFCEQSGFKKINLTDAHIIALESVEKIENHKDPFDKVLLAQAEFEGFQFITHDTKFAQYTAKNIVLV